MRFPFHYKRVVGKTVKKRHTISLTQNCSKPPFYFRDTTVQYIQCGFQLPSIKMELYQIDLTYVATKYVKI